MNFVGQDNILPHVSKLAALTKWVSAALWSESIFHK